MPIYLYKCPECEYAEDKFIAYHDIDTPYLCPKCYTVLLRQPTAHALQFIRKKKS